MAYCTVDDLLIGDTPVSGALDPAKYVNDAANEIDSKIGFRYVTPVTSTARPVTLLLKRLNAHLASGRLIMAATIAAENEQLNAYGRSLVRDATAVIEAIADGTQVLPGAILDPSIPPQDDTARVPMIFNKDGESQVEAFYDRIAMPMTLTPERWRP